MKRAKKKALINIGCIFMGLVFKPLFAGPLLVRFPCPLAAGIHNHFSWENLTTSQSVTSLLPAFATKHFNPFQQGIRFQFKVDPDMILSKTTL